MNKRGFTLIEMMVAIGILTVIVVLSIGIFSRFMRLQESATQTQILLEGMRSSLELMNREIRTGFGSTYVVADGAGSGVLFRNQDGVCVHYRWKDGGLERAESAVGGAECVITDFSGAKYARLTNSKIVIKDMRFDATTADVVAGKLQNQGFVTTMISATTERNAGQPLHLQSTITSRQVIPYTAR